MDVREEVLKAGRDIGVEYQELLQKMIEEIAHPGYQSGGALFEISQKIANSVTLLATKAQSLKDEDWVDPSDPTFIAENELLNAAKSIENAALKLAALKPRRELKSKVN